MAHYCINTNGQIAIADNKRQGRHAHYENVTIENQSTTTKYRVQFFADGRQPGPWVDVEAGTTGNIRIGVQSSYAAGSLIVVQNNSYASLYPGAIAVDKDGGCFPSKADVGNDGYPPGAVIHICTCLTTNIFAADAGGNGVSPTDSVLEGWNELEGIAARGLVAGVVTELRAKDGGESYFTTTRPKELNVDVVKGFIKVVAGV